MHLLLGSLGECRFHLRWQSEQLPVAVRTDCTTLTQNRASHMASAIAEDPLLPYSTETKVALYDKNVKEGPSSCRLV